MSSKGEKVTQLVAGLKHGVVTKLRDIWWVLLVRGVLALALAVCALFWPQQTIGLLVKLLGGYFLCDGAANIIGSWRSGGKGSYLMGAIISLAAGLALIFWTGISAKLFMLLVGVWALLQGASLFLSSRSMDTEDDARGLAGITGVVVALVGILFITWPETGVVAMSWLIAIGSLVVGGLLIFLATRLKRVSKRLDKAGR